MLMKYRAKNIAKQLVLLSRSIERRAVNWQLSIKCPTCKWKFDSYCKSSFAITFAQAIS